MTSPNNDEDWRSQGSREHTRVLILEDVPRDADLMVRELRQAGLTPEVHVVIGHREYMQELDRGAEPIPAISRNKKAILTKITIFHSNVSEILLRF